MYPSKKYTFIHATKTGGTAILHFWTFKTPML